MVFRIFILLTLAFLCPQSRAEEVVKIPLSEIWAGGMPGTKKFDFGHITSQAQIRSLDIPILKDADYRRKDGSVKQGFCVTGGGIEALRQAKQTLLDKNRLKGSFSAKDPITIVFFTTEIHPYVELQGAEKAGNTINVRYKFIPHETEDMSQYFALIPLGKLPAGKYEVKFLLSELDPEFAGGWFERTKDEHARLCVCGNFSFSVSEKVK